MADTQTGVGVSSGVVAGPALWFTRAIPHPPEGQRHDGDAAAETRRAVDALTATAEELAARGRRVEGEANDVLTAQALVARDPALAEDMKERIEAGTSASRAAFEAFQSYRDTLGNAGSHIATRVSDLDDVRDRVVAWLLDIPVPGVPDSERPFVLLARDLEPADTALLDPGKVLAFVTQEGGSTSHTAVLARSLGIPAVVACPGCEEIGDGTTVLVDGTSGEVTTDPDTALVKRADARTAARAAAVAETDGYGGTGDGHMVPLLANIGGPKDAVTALENGAEGVGLYRTEFMYLDRTDVPSDAEQVAAYRAVLEAFPASTVVVRTLDVGADKSAGFLPSSETVPNPALGERGVRLMRRYPEILEAQLVALAQAAADTVAELEVMAPMVTDVADAEWFAAAAARAGIETTGVMIEVPAAALRVAELAEVVSFFSIGTNDLAQYACAADRGVAALNRFQDPWQPGLLDLLATAVTGAAGAERPIGSCGEAAADPMLACVLVGLGVTSLSMDATAIPMVRSALARHTLAQCENAARAARAARSASAARQAAREELPRLADLGL